MWFSPSHPLKNVKNWVKSRGPAGDQLMQILFINAPYFLSHKKLTKSKPVSLA